MRFSLIIDPKALKDIQDAVDYYEEEQPGLGERFESVLNQHLVGLLKSPFFEIRYDDVRCLPVRKFPYMVHFTVDEVNMEVTIRALFHTSRNTEKLKLK